MDFEIYCDESCQEALVQKTAHDFIAIGGIWIPADFREAFKEGLKSIKKKHNVHGELKWNKVSQAYYGLYYDCVEFFLRSPEIRFRVILIESKIVDNIRFNHKDSELGFYKFYYQLLHHWIYDFNRYKIFLDFKSNRKGTRLSELKQVLSAANLSSSITQVQAVPSNESLGVQLADVLTGMVSAKFNKRVVSIPKLNLIRFLEEKFNKGISPTHKWEEKFNVFKINLQGGW